MAFRKDRVRVVAVYTLPQMSAQSFEQQFSNDIQNFLKLPAVQKNVLKFDIVRRFVKYPVVADTPR